MSTEDFTEQNDLEINNLPNRLTIFRVLLIPLVIGCLYFADESKQLVDPETQSLLNWTAGWICTLACITDFFDGYIARKRGIVTVFGSFLDPIADKFLTVASLIMLGSLGRIPSLIVIILVLREMYMTSLRLLANNEGISVPVSNLGKWKTAAIMFALPWLMANEPWHIFPLPQMGITLVYISFILSMVSAFKYSRSLVANLKMDRQRKRELKKLKGQKDKSDE